MNSGTSIRLLQPSPEMAGQRLDKVLTLLCPDLSRAHLARLIAGGLLSTRDQKPRTIEDANYRVKPGDRFALSIPPPSDPEPAAEAIPLDVLYEDDDLIIVNKPAGMVVHAGPGHAKGTLVNALIGHCGDRLLGIGGVRRPGIVHRLDKDTSGVMAAAKSEAGHAGLSRLFAVHDLERSYLALVRGVPRPASGRIETRIGRSPTNRQKMAILTRGGRMAATRYQVLEALGPAGLLRLDLETGRTHQIRVHLAHMGHPVLGDPLYGRARRLMPKALSTKAVIERFPRQALHAYRLVFRHPLTGRMLSFEAPLPEDMNGLIEALRKSQEKTE